MAADGTNQLIPPPIVQRCVSIQAAELSNVPQEQRTRCGICLGEFRLESASALSCNHAFCHSCLVAFLLSPCEVDSDSDEGDFLQKNCPICRKAIDYSKGITNWDAFREYFSQTQGKEAKPQCCLCLKPELVVCTACYKLYCTYHAINPNYHQPDHPTVPFNGEVRFEILRKFVSDHRASVAKLKEEAELMKERRNELAMKLGKRVLHLMEQKLQNSGLHGGGHDSQIVNTTNELSSIETDLSSLEGFLNIFLPKDRAEEAEGATGNAKDNGNRHSCALACEGTQTFSAKRWQLALSDASLAARYVDGRCNFLDHLVTNCMGEGLAEGMKSLPQPHFSRTALQTFLKEKKVFEFYQNDQEKIDKALSDQVDNVLTVFTKEWLLGSLVTLHDREEREEKERIEREKAKETPPKEPELIRPYNNPPEAPPPPDRLVYHPDALDDDQPTLRHPVHEFRDICYAHTADGERVLAATNTDGLWILTPTFDVVERQLRGQKLEAMCRNKEHIFISKSGKWEHGVDVKEKEILILDATTLSLVKSLSTDALTESLAVDYSGMGANSSHLFYVEDRRFLKKVEISKLLDPNSKEIWTSTLKEDNTGIYREEVGAALMKTVLSTYSEDFIGFYTFAVTEKEIFIRGWKNDYKNVVYVYDVNGAFKRRFPVAREDGHSIAMESSNVKKGIHSDGNGNIFVFTSDIVAFDESGSLLGTVMYRNSTGGLPLAVLSLAVNDGFIYVAKQDGLGRRPLPLRPPAPAERGDSQHYDGELALEMKGAQRE